MTSVTLDIATRFIGEQEDIYVIRPGDAFSLYNDFIEKSAVFLDFPDIRLAFDGARPTRDALRQAVVRSLAAQQWHRGRRLGKEPSREPADYVNATFGRRVGHYVSAIDRLYYTLPEGTILVVPGPGYFSDVLIGEIVGEPFGLRGVSLYPGETLPARKIRWIGRRAKARFSETLRDRLQRPTPLMVIERSLRAEILEAAFDQYAIGDTFSARLRTTDDDFSTLDDYAIQAFLTYVSGVLGAVEAGTLPRQQMDMDAAVKVLKANRDFALELTANINSPGALRVYSKRVAVLTAVALLTIAMSSTSTSTAQPNNIKVVNSAVAGEDPCALTVQSQAVNAIKMMDLDTWHERCVQVRDAAKSTGLATTMKVVTKSGKP